MTSCTPNFIPSSIGTFMSSINESKARLLTSGSLFVTKEVGSAVDNISIKIQWYVCITSGAPACVPLDNSGLKINNSTARLYNPSVDSLGDVIAVEIVIYDNSVEVERWGALQSVDDSGSPIVWISGIAALRIVLNSNSTYIIMPDLDIQTLGTGGTGVNVNTWDSSLDDGDHLAELLETNLSGGSGLNNSPSETYLNSIRTGPAFTLININNSEINTNDGSMEILNQPRYWNGGCWKLFSPLNPVSACDDDITCP